MKPKRPRQFKKSGRATTYERGNSLWESETETGSFKRDIDTRRLKRLENAGLTVADTSGKQPGIDPYNHAVEPPRPDEPAAKARRKSIDDLRKPSEESKQKQSLQNPKKYVPASG
jgi:hypothetical protein